MFVMGRAGLGRYPYVQQNSGGCAQPKPRHQQRATYPHGRRTRQVPENVSMNDRVTIAIPLAEVRSKMKSRSTTKGRQVDLAGEFRHDFLDGGLRLETGRTRCEFQRNFLLL